VIHRLELIAPQQFGQFPCVDTVVPVADLHERISAWIAHYHSGSVRFQQVIQPSSGGSFLKGDLQIAAQSTHKLQNHTGFGLDDTFHHDLSRSIPDRDRNAFLVYIHPDIFSADHQGRSSSGAVELALKTYSTRGALLYCVDFPGVDEYWCNFAGRKSNAH
jgi:hypothetical protein